MPCCFQITLEGNGFHISFSPKSTLIRKERKISFLKRRTELNLEDQSSLYSTVDIDDRNNCRPSSAKSENKHIILDTSEQALSSSYCNNQDSNTEDHSSTNRNTSDQNLFISMTESDSENSEIDIARLKKKKIKKQVVVKVKG